MAQEKKKLSFRPYHSIENHYQDECRKKLAKFALLRPSLEWIATEKVHGANFQMSTNGVDVWAGKRSGPLSNKDNAGFFGFMSVFNEHREKVIRAFQLIKIKDAGVTDVIFYGELFGGGYPHPDVPEIAGVKLVQKHAYYYNNLHFYAFDIWTNTTGFLDYDTCETIWKQCGFLYAKTLARGPLSQLYAMEVDNVPSWIPAHFDLPPIPHNFMEGVVIRPVDPRILHRISGKQLFDLPDLVVKKKAKEFMEVTTKKTYAELDKKDRKSKIHSMEEAEKLGIVGSIEDCRRYITTQRFENVVSKLGTGKTGSLYTAFLKDVICDWRKADQNSAHMDQWTKEQKACFYSHITSQCSLFIDEQLM